MLSMLGCAQLLLPARHAAPASAPRQNAEQRVRLFVAAEGAASAQRMTRLVKTLTSDRGAEDDVLARSFEKTKPTYRQKQALLSVFLALQRTNVHLHRRPASQKPLPHATSFPSLAFLLRD